MDKIWHHAKLKCKQFLPSEAVLRQHRALRFLGRYFNYPGLWHFNHRSIPRGVAIGLFMACIPMPFQMVPAALVAILLRANLLFAIGLVWVSNPLTWIPIYYGLYCFGTWILRTPVQPEIQWNIDTFMHQLNGIWLPLLVGCLLGGVIAGGFGYLLAKGIYWLLRRRDSL